MTYKGHTTLPYDVLDWIWIGYDVLFCIVMSAMQAKGFNVVARVVLRVGYKFFECGI